MSMSLPILESERLLLRELSISDAESMYYYAKEDTVTEYVLFETHKSINDSLTFINQAIEKYANADYYVWAIELKKNKHFIGSCGIHDIDRMNRSAELGYIISHDYWNQGIATEAGNLLMDFGFNNLKLHRIYARYFEGNEASRRVMEKLGMRYEGIMRDAVFKRNRYYNIHTFAKLEND